MGKGVAGFGVVVGEGVVETVVEGVVDTVVDGVAEAVLGACGDTVDGGRVTVVGPASTCDV